MFVGKKELGFELHRTLHGASNVLLSLSCIDESQPPKHRWQCKKSHNGGRDGRVKTVGSGTPPFFRQHFVIRDIGLENTSASFSVVCHCSDFDIHAQH